MLFQGDDLFNHVIGREIHFYSILLQIFCIEFYLLLRTTMKTVCAAQLFILNETGIIFGFVVADTVILFIPGKNKKKLKQFCDIFVSSICISNWKKHVDDLNVCSLETFCASGYIYDLRMFLQHLLQIPKRLFVALFHTKLLLARYYALGKFGYTDSHACIAFLFFLNLVNKIYWMIRVMIQCNSYNCSYQN